MDKFPVPLDNLITYVKALHPDGGPLDNVGDAMAVATQLTAGSYPGTGSFVLYGSPCEPKRTRRHTRRTSGPSASMLS